MDTQNIDRKITKVKQSAGKITINYFIDRAEDKRDEYQMVCTDLPLPEFDTAMQSIKNVLGTWCETTTEYFDYFDNAEIRGVSFSWAHGIMGACVTAIKPLKSCNSPIVINAPHKSSLPYTEGGDDSVCLTFEQSNAVLALYKEAEKYLDGSRAQMELPLQ